MTFLSLAEIQLRVARAPWAPPGYSYVQRVCISDKSRISNNAINLRIPSIQNPCWLAWQLNIVQIAQRQRIFMMTLRIFMMTA